MLQRDEIAAILRHTKVGGMFDIVCDVIAEVFPGMQGWLLLYAVFNLGYTQGIHDERERRRITG